MKTIQIVMCTLAAGFLASTAAAAASKTPAPYHAKTWGDAVQHAPCSYFKKNSDGSWTQIGTIIVGNGTGLKVTDGTVEGPGSLIADNITNATLTGNSFKNSSEARELDSRCGHQ